MVVTGRGCFDTTLTPRDQIIGYARKVLDEFAATDVWDPAAQLRAASTHTAHEYVGRFLLELLQNAHDAHPATRHDGRIKIVVDADEGAHGVVYVANAGNPFTHQSMTGLCKLARSPKQVGQGIGHKGVGFRSILPVCAWPEIYSADPVGPPGNLDGYTFRFARHADLLALTGGDEALAERADAEFPPFQLPFPADTIPDAVRDLAVAGHVTVVRLPLDTAEASREALAQAAKVAASDIPVLLFLERIESLTVVRRGGNGGTEPATLTRHRRPLAGVPSSSVSFSQADLGDLGVYTVASKPVVAARLQEAVGAARRANLMSADWDAWDDAVVSVAIPAQAEVEGRMFTFLPMGDKAPSPFAGHLNAPFFTKLDRTDLDPGHPLNNLLLDIAAETALDAAAVLQASGVSAARGWVSDLVCWDGPHRHRLAEAADRSGAGRLTERPLVPVEATVAPGTGWASLADTYRWPGDNLTVLTAARAAEDGTRLLDSTLSPRRTARWEVTADWLDSPLTPDADTLAEFVERIVAAVERPAAYDDTGGALRTRRPKNHKTKSTKKGAARTRPAPGDAARSQVWASIYSDLAALFSADIAEAVRGRSLLVDDAGDLRPTNTPAPPPGKRAGGRPVRAFLPPARDENPVAVPASLRQHIFYLHPAIAEQLDSAGRTFLVDANLTYSYDIRNLLDHVDSIVARSESERIHRDALRFVFTLEQNGQIPPSYPLKQMHLRIPTTAGTMVRAAFAAFGPGWDAGDGADLAAVIADAGDLDRDLAALGKCLVDPTPELVRHTDSRAEWRMFLAKIGVADGLRTYTTSVATPKLMGWQIRGATLAARARLPNPVAEQWATHLATHGALNILHPQTEYVVSRKPMWAAGQAIAERLTDPARDAYARLMLHGLDHWPADYLKIHWDRDRYGNKDRQTVPTPLASFLASAAWLPAAPGAGRPSFARPDQLWHFPASSDDATPGFAPLVNQATRGFLESHPKVFATLKAAGLGVWSDPAHAARLVRVLGEAAAAGWVGDQRDQFLRAYLRAWSNLACRLEPELGDVRNLALVLRQGPGLLVRRVEELVADGVTVHLARPGEGLHLRLLDELELPVLFVDGNLDGARGHLAAGLGDHVRIVDESAVAVAPTGVIEPPEPLVDQLPWVAVLVAAAADHGQGLTLRERDFEALAGRLRRLRVRTYTNLGLSLFNQPTELPAARHGLFAEPDDTDPTVLAPIRLPSLAGPALVALAEEVAVAVGYPRLQERLRAAVLELQQGGNDQPDPDHTELARALRLSAAQVAATRTRLDGGLDAIISRLYPLLVLWAGRDRADAVVDTARAAADPSELPTALKPLTDLLPVAADTLAVAARTATSLEELRVAVGVAFAELNTTLFAMGSPYAPISHQAEHEQALRQHLNLFRRQLCDRLRWARLAEFDARHPQMGWPELRSFDWVTVPELWGTTVEEATRGDLNDLVDTAFEIRLGVPPPTGGPVLAALETLAASNKALVNRAGPSVARIARAWSTAHRVPLIPALWSDNPGDEIAAVFDANGVLDFRELTDEDIPAWLAVLDLWPAGMPVTTDPVSAGVTAEHLEAADSAATVARRERERQRRLVRIGGDDIDVGVGAIDMAALIDALQTKVEANPAVIATPNRVSHLQPVPDRNHRGGSGGGGSRDPMAGLSDEQRQGVGFAGEWLAYQWLIRHYREANESSWVSTNRRRVFAGDPGNDSLGYDFRVELAEPIMFEVKASHDDPGMFSLTDSEIREARRHAHNGRWRLLVVPYVSDTSRCRVLRLLNPFDPRAEGMFRPDSEGIRYRYKLTT